MIMHAHSFFHQTTVQTETSVGILNVAALPGIFASQAVSDRFGRTRTLAFASLLFCAGSFTMASAHSFGVLVIGRILVGVGLGFGLSIDPLYIAEVAPPKYRGFFVSWSEFAINAGILLGFVSAYVFSAEKSWRFMFAAGGILPVAMLLLSVFVMPETPRFLLVRKHRPDAARRVLARLCTTSAEADATFEDIERSAAFDDQLEEGWSGIFRPSAGVKLMIIVVVVTAMAQQFSGVEAFMYYSPFLLERAGFASDEKAFLITLIMGIIKTLALIFVAWALDQGTIGRRKLLIASYSLMAADLIVLAVAVATSNKTLLVIGMFTYVVFFSLGAGPICWLFASEIIPTRLRAKGMVLAAGCNRIVASLVSLTFLSFSDGETGGAAFIFFSCCCVLTSWFVYTTCPETRGKNLEGMEPMFERIARRRKLQPWLSILCSRVAEISSEDEEDSVELVGVGQARSA